MPAAVVAIGAMAAGTAVATAVVGTITAASTIGTILAYSAVSIATSMAVSTIGNKLIGGGDSQRTPQQAASPAAQAERGMIVNTAGTTDAIPVIYGTRRIGGTRCLTESSGSTKEYLHIVLAHCEGEVSSITNLRLDNVLYTDSRFSGLVTFETAVGTDAQAANASLVSALPSVWTSNHKLSGVAYSYVRLKFNSTAFHSIPVMSVDINGKKVYDPRDTLTKFSANPALCILDYLTNTRYGRGISLSDIDTTSFITAANYCDVSITTPTGTQPRYTCNMIVNTDNTSIDNLNLMLTTCRGMLVFTGGKYKLVLDKSEVPGFTFNEDNIVGAWKIILSDKRSRFNRIRGQWIDPSRDYQPNIVVSDSSTFRTSDNGLLLESQIDLPGTTNAYEAQMLVGRHLRQSRFGIVVQFTATIAGTLSEVGDVVYITHSTPGWTNKPFRIANISLLNHDEVQITCGEYDDSVYTEDPLNAPATTVTTNLPDMFSVSAPSGVSLDSGTDSLVLTGDGTIVSRLKVSWGAIPDAFARTVEIRYKESSASTWTYVTDLNSSASFYFIEPVRDGVSYDVNIRALNNYGTPSTWAAVTDHVIVGKTALPTTVTGFTATVGKGNVLLSWNKVTDTDLKQYEIRFGGTNWDNATFVAATSATQLFVNPVTTGTYTWRIKSQDTNDNFSAVATTTLTVAGPGTPVVSQGITGQNFELTWTIPSSAFQIIYYEIRYGASWATSTAVGTSNTNIFTAPVDWGGERRFWISAVDSALNAGTPGSASIVITAPAPPVVTSSVVDNNVLLYWTASDRSLPVQYYDIRKGNEYATSESIGTKQGLFTSNFETLAGVYTYWVVGVDSAGNVGTPSSLSATINQPPDYILNANYWSTFNGTLSNATKYDSTVTLPVNTTQTFAEHFTSNGWSTPQDQINAGYPLYIQPTVSTGSYIETIDYGGVLAATKITVTPTYTVISGNPAVSVILRYRLNDFGPWTTAASGSPNGAEAFVTNFRYIQIEFAVTTTSAIDLIEITDINTRLDSKLKSINGMVTCNAADSGGTTVYITDDRTSLGTAEFTDVDSIQLTPSGTTSITAIYDFTDTPNPISFKVLLFDSTTGTRVSGNASYLVRGF